MPGRSSRVTPTEHVCVATSQVSNQDLLLSSGKGFDELKVPLPVLVDTDTIKAKFDKKKGRLTIKLSALQ